MPQLSRGEILDRVTLGESLRGINLVRADLSACELSRADLAEANLRMADLSRADLTEARLMGCFLSGATLSGAILVGATLVESSMIGATLLGADLSRADLSGADLTGASLHSADLTGAYLVGTFLNETDLSGANLTGAYIRMAQMAGANLSGGMLEGADLSYADLSGVRLDGCSMVGANLTGANLSASTLTGCDLRGADLTGADLRGCNLTGTRLRDMKFAGVKLDDAWAEWVDLSAKAEDEQRASLEEAFVGMIGKPIAQVLVDGRVGDDVWAVVLAHLCEFQVMHPRYSDVRLKAIHQGISSSALYLEAERELSLAAYLAELADILGKGSVELFERLGTIVSDHKGSSLEAGIDVLNSTSSMFGMAAHAAIGQSNGSRSPVSQAQSRGEALQTTSFWASDKAFVILTGGRQVWLEAASNPSLTLRPPHGAAMGIDLVRGHFVTDDPRKSRIGNG